MNIITNDLPISKFETMLDSAHMPLIGKLAVLTDFGVMLSEQYDLLYGFGSPFSDKNLLRYCQDTGKYKVRLMFINEPSVKVENLRLFCLKEVGTGIGKFGDWHWYTLDQLMVCD